MVGIVPGHAGSLDSREVVVDERQADEWIHDPEGAGRKGSEDRGHLAHLHAESLVLPDSFKTDVGSFQFQESDAFVVQHGGEHGNILADLPVHEKPGPHQAERTAPLERLVDLSVSLAGLLPDVAFVGHVHHARQADLGPGTGSEKSYQPQSHRETKSHAPEFTH